MLRQSNGREICKPIYSACASVIGLVGVAGLLAACSGGPALGPGAATDGHKTNSQISTTSARPAAAAPARESLADLTRRSAEAPQDVAVALRYARHLKAAGKPKEALEVLDRAEGAGTSNVAFITEQGLLSLQLGDARKAQQLLSKAAPESTKDWRVPSGLGVALATLGRQSEAQKQLTRALELSPGNPIVLNNLAMSNILDRKVDKAEVLLNTAKNSGTQRPHVAQNLNLAMALKGLPESAQDAPMPLQAPQRTAASEIAPAQLQARSEQQR